MSGNLESFTYLAYMAMTWQRSLNKLFARRNIPQAAGQSDFVQEVMYADFEQSR
jgi:hypothetical protein